MIGFLLWVNARNRNDELRKRLEKYEGPPPPPPPTSGREYLLAFLLVAGLIAIVALSAAGCATTPEKPAYPSTSSRWK